MPDPLFVLSKVLSWDDMRCWETLLVGSCSKADRVHTVQEAIGLCLLRCGRSIENPKPNEQSASDGHRVLMCISNKVVD
jgi:hypothetical protein